MEIGCDTVNIPFLITGSAMDKERVIKVRLSPEDTITAEESMYELLSGSVPAGSYQGQLQVKINYSPLLDDSVYVTRLRVVATEDFPVTDLNGRVFSLYITNKIGRPANWSQLNNYFGEYSDSWYRFILDATGLPSLPYWSPRGSAPLPGGQAHGGTVQSSPLGKQLRRRLAGDGIVQLVLDEGVEGFRCLAVFVVVIAALFKHIRNFLIGPPLAGTNFPNPFQQLIKVILAKGAAVLHHRYPKKLPCSLKSDR